MKYLSGKPIAAVLVLLILAATFVTLHGQGSGTRRVTAYFDRTVSLYKGSEVRVMGVNIGTVTAVVPEGDRVRVSMKYDDEYKLPANAKAAIITPTLTADRFVQIAPA
jgi:phospholipid/cholesterol/gamma-HCH transport system substrate-binding protein